MINVKDIDYDLSLKLGDPVNDTGDGTLFSRQDRIKYLSRAYGRLLRILEKIGGAYQPLFSKMLWHEIIVLEGDAEKSGYRIVPKQGFRSIKELYIETTDNKMIQAVYLDEDRYIGVANDQNELYLPDYEKGNIFYTIFSGGIQLRPGSPTKKYAKLHWVYQKDIPQLDMDSVIEISNDYRDLLIVMAAKEGMEDLPRADKVQLYTADINAQLQILGLSIQKQEQGEGGISG